MPAYYVTTNGDAVVVYNYQGAKGKHVKVLDSKRSELRERFDDLYRLLSPKAVADARRPKADQFQGAPNP